MDDIFIYAVSLPAGVHEVVLPCADGYTIYLSEADSRERQIQSYYHAIRHITGNDWDKTDIQNIEGEAHDR